MKLKELAQQIGGDLQGDGRGEVKGLASLKQAGPGDVSFLNDKRYEGQLAQTKAAAVIVPRNCQSVSSAELIFVDDVDDAMGVLLEHFADSDAKPESGIHPGAIIDSSAQLADDVSVGPGAVIEKGVTIGPGTVISAGCVIGHGVQIGQNCFLWPNVVVNYKCRLGNNVIIHANSTIGTDGFGYRMVEGRYRKIPHIGTVIIEDDVEIGANSCVDRAKLGRTVVGRGTKIDNLVMVAHNVQIGENCIIVSQTGIAGSCELGDFVVLAGQCGISDHVTIGDQAMLGPQSGVPSGSDIQAKAKLMGAPIREFREYYRELSLIKKLPELAKEIKQIKKRLDK